MITQNIKNRKNLYKTLGPEGAKLILFLSQNKKNVFSTQEAAKILRTNTSKIWKLLNGLVGKGWLQRFEKGKYLLLPLGVDATQPYTEHQFIIGSQLIAPYFIGYWSILNYYGYTEQLQNTIFIASTKRKKETMIAGIKYKFIKIPEYKMFGLANIEINNTHVRVSDREKTLIDCLDHPEFCGGIIEITKGIWNAREEIDFDKLVNYARKIRNSAVSKRLGYLLEILGLEKKVRANALQELIAKGFSPLDPLLPKKGKTISRWNLIVNISEEEILSWRRV